MNCPSIEVVGEKEFDQREWLRREVLWGSLVAPYDLQLDGWRKDIEHSYFSGNVGRKDVYGKLRDDEGQSLSAFNHGKSVATLLSSVALFKTCMRGLLDESPNKLLELQAECIDTVLDKNQQRINYASDENETFQRCTWLVKRADHLESAVGLGYKHCYLRASRLMAGLAVRELESWNRLLEENKDYTLTLPDGGSPRSVGPKVEELQPIFHSLVESAEFKSLSN